MYTRCPYKNIIQTYSVSHKDRLCVAQFFMNQTLHIVHIISCENKNALNTFLTLKSWVLYLFWQKCLSKLQYIEFENIYLTSFSYNLKKRVERNCHLIQFVSRLFIKSLVGDKLDFSLLTLTVPSHALTWGENLSWGEFYSYSLIVKVENIWKGNPDLIPSSSFSVKIQIMGGKVCLRCKGKTLLGVVNKLLKTKSLLRSPSNVLPYYLK